MAKISKVKIFVPFINPNMARRFFKENKNTDELDIELIDNRERKAGLSLIYNEVIQRYLNEDVWLFFVHEDFEIQGKFFDTSHLPLNAIYGTCGVKLQSGYIPVCYGLHKCSNKDGSDKINVGIEVDKPTLVDTLDCQSILLHTKTLRDRPRLRFDEALSFDLYAEDLCILAQEKYGLPVMVLPLDFQHYSKGKVSERYWRGTRHLAAKYPTVGTAGTCSFLGGNVGHLEAHFSYDIPANPASERNSL